MDLSNLPLAYFPLVNIALVWMGVPLSAWICRRNPVIGLAPYGFILVNGLMHCLGTLVGEGFDLFVMSPVDHLHLFSMAFCGHFS